MIIWSCSVQESPLNFVYGKKIAVLLRDRQAEALRMAIDLSLEDDEVHVYSMDKKIDFDDRDIVVNLEMLRELGIRIFSNYPDDTFETVANDVIARELVHYDSVIPY